jgi:hypothetical protein
MMRHPVGKILLGAAVCTAVTMAAFALAFAQEGGHHGGACRDDAAKLCAGVQRGGGHILDCLAGQKDKLSDDCRKMVESRGK